MTEGEDHVCTLDQSCREGCPCGCRCGRWFIWLSGRALRDAMCSWTLVGRLRDYQREINLGHVSTIAEAITAATQHRLRQRAADRQEIELRARRKLDESYRFAKFMHVARKRLMPPGTPCHYCPADAQTIDHVLPQSRWPELRFVNSNLVPACKRCNSAKNNRTPDEWRSRMRVAA